MKTQAKGQNQEGTSNTGNKGLVMRKNIREALQTDSEMEEPNTKQVMNTIGEMTADGTGAES